MSARSVAAKKLILATAAILAVLSGVLVFLNRSPSAQLRLLQTEAESLFATPDPHRRDQFAENCYTLARRLVNENDPIGAAASLYVISIAPVVSADAADVAIPDESRVESIASVDLLNIARLFFSTRRFGPADQLVNLILTREDEHRVAGLRLAITIRFDLGRDDDVLAHCNELLTQVPGDAKAYRVIALVHRNHGRWESFVEAAQNALKNSESNDLELRVNLADGLVKLGRTAEARTEFDIVQRLRPDLAARAPVLHARLLLQEGNHEKADRILSSFLKRVPDDAEALVLKATLLLAEEEFDVAIRLLQSAIEIDPADEQAYYQLGQAYARNNQPDVARETLEKHRRLLDAKIRLHEMEELAAREPGNTTVRVELAHSYAEIGLTELADFWTRAALAADGR